MEDIGMGSRVPDGIYRHYLRHHKMSTEYLWLQSAAACLHSSASFDMGFVISFRLFLKDLKCGYLELFSDK
jgi:hypothetical protein